MQLTALGDLYRDMSAQYLLHALRERLARVTAVAKQALHTAQAPLAALERGQCPLAVRHLGRGHGHRVWQALRVHCNMAFDARDLLACVIAL